MLKRILKISGIVLGSILVLAVALTEIFESRIEAALISELQSQVTSKVEVATFDLSLIRSFPRVSANLGGVVIEDTNEQVLLECEQIGFRLGLFSLFGSNLKLRSVVVSNGALRIAIDENGAANYDIMQPAPEEAAPEESGDFAISLAEAHLEDIELIYEDATTDQNVLLQVAEATFAGEISSTKFELESTAQVYSNFIETGTSRYLAGKEISYDARILVDLEEGIYEFKDVVVDIEDNTFRVTGSINEEPGFTEVDLTATIEDGSLGGVMEFLPADYLDLAGGLKSRGTFYFNAVAQGRYNDRTNPAIEVNFGLQDGRIESEILADDLKDVSFDATFTNGDKQRNSTSTFHLNDFRAFIDRELIEISMQLDNFDDPDVDFQMDGILPLNSTYGMLGSNVTGGEGEVEFKNVRVQGRYSDMVRNTRAGRVQASGTIEFDDTGVTINGERMRFDRGELIINNNLLAIRDLELEGAGTEIVLNGNFNNLLPVLLADSLNSKDAFLEFEAQLTAREIDIEKLVALTEVPETEERESQQQAVRAEERTDVEHREWLASFLEGTFAAEIDRYSYGELEGTDFAGELKFHDREMAIDGETNAMDGAFSVDGKMVFVEEPYLDLKLVTDQVDISEFFRQTGDFGQEEITYRNVSGRMNAKVRIEAFFDADGNFLSDKLHVIAGIGLENGRLKDLEMLESFASVIHLEELRDIEIVSLVNYLEISNSTLHIPVMFIQSTALNLTISGTHTFDNVLNYNIKVNAGQVVFNKIKKYDPSMEPVEAKKKGWFNVYRKIEGPIDTYEVHTGKREIKQEFAQSEYLKRELRIRLINAFGDIQLVEEPEAWNDIPEFSGWDEEVEDEYLEGFDDW